MKNFLLEIGTEPLPYQEVSNLLLQLKNRFISLLEEKKVGFSDLKVLGTLRRLTLFISSIPEKTPDEEKVILGPPWEVAFNQIGDPLLPALRFAGRLGYKAKDLIKVSTDKGVYAGLKVRKEGKEVKKILEEEIPRIISSLKLRQSMKWGEGRGPFVRPIRWILALIGEEVVKFKIFGLESSNYTHGHLLYAENRKVEIGKADLEEYKKILREYFVIVDPREREETIGSKIEELLKGEKPVLVEKVKERNTWSLEYPVPFKCSFPSNFLSLPREVIIACLVEHQNYIPLEMDKKLSSCFVVVGEGINENLTSVKEGHERVVKARLSDAEFFWKEDLKIPLQARVESLKQLSFHENLGSYYEKVSRLKKIAKKFAEILNLSEEEKDKLFRATFLSKADLLTHMVQEFPSLQGIMGGKYALAQGEDRDVAQAIEDQYLPFAEWKSGLPKNRIGVILALSDRLDTLGGYTASDMLPTGSSDPYGLRKNALAIIKLLIEGKVEISLDEMLKFVMKLWDKENKWEELWRFLLTRFRFSLLEEGKSYDIVEGVLARPSYNIKDMWERILAFEKLREEGKFYQMVVPYKRIANILKQASELYGWNKYSKPKEELILQKEEKMLWEESKRLHQVFPELYNAKAYSSILEELTKLKEKVDEYFDRVLVMEEEEEKRKNHLAVLYSIYNFFSPLADFTRFRGEEERR